VDSLKHLGLLFLVLYLPFSLLANDGDGNGTILDCDLPIIYSDNNQTVVARGNARIVNREILLQADSLTWDRTTDHVEAKGEVVLNYKDLRLLADWLEVDLQSGEYWAKEARVGSSRFALEAKRLKRAQSHLYAERATLYPVDPSVWAPNLLLSNFTYSEENQSISLNGIVPRLGKLPFGYLPSAKASTINSSFFRPSAKIGKSGHLGWYLTSAFASDNSGADRIWEYEMTAYEKRGVLLAPSLYPTFGHDFTFEEHSFSGGWIRDQDSTGVDGRGLPIEPHRAYAEVRSVILNDNLRFANRLDWQTDPDMIRDFKRDEFDKTQWRRSFSELTYRGKGYYLSLFASGQTTKHFRELEYLPSISLTGGPARYLGIYHSLSLNLSKMVQKDQLGRNTDSAEKLDFGYQIMKPLILAPGITYTPSISARNQLYDIDHRQSQRTYGEWSNDLSVEFLGKFDYRNNTLGIDGLNHRSQLLFSHRRVALLDLENEEDLPNFFDSVEQVNLTPIDLMDLKEDRLMRAYDVIRLGWLNDLSSQGRSIVRADFYYDIWKASQSSSKSMPFFSKIEWSMLPWLEMGAVTHIDTRSGDNLKRNVSLSLVDGRFHRYSFGYSSFLDWNDFVSFESAHVINEKIHSSLGAWYNADRSELTFWSLSIDYFYQPSICYTASLSERKGSRKEDNLEFSLGLTLFSF